MSNGSVGVDRERLDRLAALAEAATAGPWRQGLYGFDGTIDMVFSDAGCVSSSVPPRGRTTWASGGYENAQFIAAAREAVPWLVGEVQRLAKAEQEAADVTVSAIRLMNSAGAEGDRLRAALDQVPPANPEWSENYRMGYEKARSRFRALIKTDADA